MKWVVLFLDSGANTGRSTVWKLVVVHCQLTAEEIAVTADRALRRVTLKELSRPVTSFI